MENLTIGVFAKAAGVNVETIRFYQRKGLLPEPDKPYGSIRRYGEADVTRVRFVKSAQRLGFSLDEIAELLRLDDGTHCEEASSPAEHKLQDVREKMTDLARMETVLSELVFACHARQGNVSCPLIASLQGGERAAWCRRGVAEGSYALACFYLMRWSLPPSRYYAEDRLSFGELSWKNIALIGIDLGKNSFHIHCQDRRGKAVYRKKIYPAKVDRIFGDMPRYNHRNGSLWRFSLYGTQVGRVGGIPPKLISPQFVRPFVKSNKNDFVDAEAICEAASRPSMRFVQPRTESQQAMRALHRVRESPGSG